MAKEYRIKQGYEYVVEEVEPYEEQLFKVKTYKVQVKVIFFWVTVKKYTNSSKSYRAKQLASALIGYLSNND